MNQILEIVNCRHEMQKVRYPIKGGWQCKLQCRLCGIKEKNAVKKPANFLTLPLWDEQAFVEQQEAHRLHAEHENAGNGSVNYYDYIASPEWKKVRDRTIKVHPTCQKCELFLSEAVHHITYANLGNEFWWELLAVCNDCHKEIHGITI